MSKKLYTPPCPDGLEEFVRCACCQDLVWRPSDGDMFLIDGELTCADCAEEMWATECHGGPFISLLEWLNERSDL